MPKRKVRRSTKKRKGKASAVLASVEPSEKPSDESEVIEEKSEESKNVTELDKQ